MKYALFISLICTSIFVNCQFFNDSSEESTVSSEIVPVFGAPSSFADLVEQIQPSVVYISSTQEIQTRRIHRDYWGRQYGVPETRRSQSLGSGFIIDQEGLILTNSHVIADASEISVTLFEEDRSFRASIVGTDPATDLALIRIDADRQLTPLAFGNSDQIRVGDWTIAVGNPFGLASTVTVGILSATGRRDVPVSGQLRYVDFLQTDASINPGNSGGPLLNMNGEVIGINTAINPEGQGIGFAIPANMAQTVVEQLLENGAVSRSWLGIFIGEVSPELARRSGFENPIGALITGVVRGGPAEIAGIFPGDIILNFNNQEISNSADLPWIASTAGVGSTVTVRIARGTERRSVQITLGELPE